MVAASCSTDSGRELACSSTVAPSRASRCAMAAPRAPLAPVIRARFPLRLMRLVSMASGVFSTTTARPSASGGLVASFTANW